MKHFFFLACITFTICVSGQNIDLNQKLPVNTSIKKGGLPNGMTYYIHHTDVVKNAASYYIIQNVGSILENEDQRGLAHFLEHMAFNGTKAFPKKALLNALEENGLKFGTDINAYTSFDETVYNINKLGTKPEQIDLGLQILHDWSNDLTLEEEEIDAERGVVKEEWRTRDNGYMRIMKKNMPVTFGGSKYKDRMPIGLMSVVENFDYQALRDFYHDWYRTDLQAIAIVGDIDVDDIEQRIKKKFSSIPAVKNPKERYYATFENNEKMLYTMATDKEVAKSQILFSIHSERPKYNNTIADLREDIVNYIAANVFSRRLAELTQQPNSPVSKVGFSIGKVTPMNNSFGMYITPKPNKQIKAFSLAMNELYRTIKFGTVPAELKNIKEKLTNTYQNRVAKLEDLSHSAIGLSTIKNDYLYNEVPTDLIKEFDIVKQLLDQLTVEDINKKLKEVYTTTNRKLIVTGVEGEDNLSQSKALKIIKSAENNKKLKPYVEEEDSRTLMHGITLIPGEIIDEKENQDLKFTTFTLSNGVRVHHKFSDKQKNKVKFLAKSKGGYSLIPVEDIPSARMIYPVIARSGLGAYDLLELDKKLTGKTASAKFRIKELHEEVGGLSSTRGFETMLQLVNMGFTAPRFDESAYNLAIEAEKNFIKNKKKDLGSRKRDSMVVSTYGTNNPYKNFIDNETLKTISLEKIKRIYNERFNNPADFEFFIGGDIKKEAVIPALEKYIASLPTTSKLENWKDVIPDWVSNTIDKDIYFPMENPKATVNIRKKKAMLYSRKDNYTLSLLAGILQLRFTESLREQEGGTYGASANYAFFREPKEEAQLEVSFNCNPDMVENLIKIVYSELDKIKNGEILQEDLDKVKSNKLKKRKEYKNRSDYDYRVMIKFVEDGLNADAPKNYEDIINAITLEDIQKIITEILTDSKSLEIVFKPEINQIH
ncbi:insulinase family protein [Flavivirga abyssicola]|uniref:M16 family metallopeptidase n=1 Tax=Flavivirga abyssicola TaxID=3063533 RepID=UPI0026DFBC9B|nr:M16 family metallopeptidase [Flavivirga sp. MEBiC07777]WVK12735.1 insulinase family protein [Flavivirga sp. MEBiC07777]